MCVHFTRARVCVHPSPSLVYYIYKTLYDATPTAEGCQMVKLAPDTRPFYTPHPVGVAVGSGRPAGYHRRSPAGVRHEYILYILLLRSPKLTFMDFRCRCVSSLSLMFSVVCVCVRVFFPLSLLLVFPSLISSLRLVAVTILREQVPSSKNRRTTAIFFFYLFLLPNVQYVYYRFSSVMSSLGLTIGKSRDHKTRSHTHNE